MSKIKPGLIALAAAGVLATGAVLVPVAASAANDTVTPSATAAPSQGAQRPAEEQLTGETAAKVQAAVEKKYPGATIERMEKDADGQGVYEAHITKADGTHATVFLDAGFAITGEQAGGPGHGGRGPHGDGPGGMLAGATEVTGDTLTKLTSAVTAKVPGATIDKAFQLSDGTYVALTHQADGTRVIVKLDKDLVVTGTETPPARGGHGHGPDGTDTPQPSTSTSATSGA